jgi:Arc/MetJ family transcription regulator
MEEIPLDEIPLDEVPLDEVPLDEVPLDEVPLDDNNGKQQDDQDVGGSDCTTTTTTTPNERNTTTGAVVAASSTHQQQPPAASAAQRPPPRWLYWRQCFGIPIDDQALAQQRQSYGELLERHAVALATTATTTTDELLLNDESSANSNNNDDDDDVPARIVSDSHSKTTTTQPLIPSNNNIVSFDDLDPLSALVQEQESATLRDQELERQYHRHHRRGQRGRSSNHHPNASSSSRMVVEHETPDDAAAYRELIAKDLHRLAPIIDDGEDDHNNDTAATTTTRQPQQQRQQRQQHRARIVILRRLLMIYSLEHVGGYLQGMHEIASFVLHFVSEQREPQVDPDGPPYGPEDDQNYAAAAAQQHAAVEADAYVLTAAILQGIAAAYDLDKQVSVLYQSQRILHYLVPIQPPELYGTLHRHARHVIPFQLIFTKWIRLLFGREISHVTGIGRVWDALFAVGNLQRAAEALAAARLWQYGHQILSLGHDDDDGDDDDNNNNFYYRQQQQQQQQQHGQNDGEDLMHYCMNMPVIDDPRDIDIWIRRMRVILQLEPLSPDLALPPLPRKFHPSPVPSMIPQQHHATTSVVSTLWDPTHTTTTVAAQLTSFTEKLAAQTQHLSKQFLSLEAWAGENPLQQLHHPRQPQHSQTIAPAAAPPPGPTYNLNYYSDRRPSPPPPNHGPETSTTTPTTARTSMTATPAPVDIQDRLRRDTEVLQQFAISSEQTAGVRVPPQVWSALADLEALQRYLPQ